MTPSQSYRSRRPTAPDGRHVTCARRGVTLIEAVLFIAVSLGLIVGGLVFYQQASLAARTQETIRLFSAIVQETRALYQGDAYEAEVNADETTWSPTALADADITQVLITAQAVPTDAISSGAGIVNPWGGLTRVYGGTLINGTARTPMLVIVSENVPLEACTRLMTADVTNLESISPTLPSVGGTRRWSARNLVSDGLFMVGVWTGAASPFPFYRVYSPVAAATACEYGSFPLNYFGTTPASRSPSTSQRLSGGRTIMMGFLLN